MDIVECYTVSGFIVIDGVATPLKTETFGSFSEAAETYRHNFWSASHTQAVTSIEQRIGCGSRVYCRETLTFDQV